MTNRKYDVNGFFEVPNNPLSRAGVFPYLGMSLGDGFEPDKVYNVLRPEEELSDPDTLDSFRLLPLVDDHTMLGDGMTPAEKKGVHGTIGEKVTWDAARKMMIAPLKIWSDSMADLIRRGKKELSLGYRCLYEKKTGVYDGQRYDAVQRSIRGNHVALVDQGRMGPEVAVLDHKITFDHLDIDLNELTEGSVTMNEEQVKAAIDEALKPVMAGLKTVTDALEDVSKKMCDEDEAKKDGDDDKPAADADDPAKKDDETAEGEDEVDPAEAKKDDEKIAKAVDAALKPVLKALDELKGRKPGMDAKDMMQAVGRRDDLARRLSQHVGTFDCSQMTEDEVAKYGCEKLGLKDIAKGNERAVLDGFLHARPAFTQGYGFASAANAGGSAISKHLGGNA